MNTTLQLNDIMRLIGNLVRIGNVSELDLANARCRVATGSNVTAWLPWMTHRAGRTRSWWAPSVGEQVLLLSMGGELNTAFVLPAVFSMPRPHLRLRRMPFIWPFRTAPFLNTNRQAAR